MRRCIGGGSLAAAVLVLAGGWTPARAQFYRPQPGPVIPVRPAVSPFLNLFRPGTNPAINYYGLVRPEIEFRGSIAGLQQQVGTLGAATTLEAQAAAPLPTTGHSVAFGNYGGYFGRSLSAGPVGRPAPTGGSRYTVPPSRGRPASPNVAPPR
jgi:hypothetical protein